jgi:XTP/dITP diphosphohydrolase
MIALNNKTLTIALATRNRGKVEEIRLGLITTSVEIKSVDDFPDFPEVEETEPDLKGNAALKSEALFAYSGTPSLADDTGLEVEALGGQPGVLSARYAGDDCTPADNRALLLANLTGVGNRSAQFRTVLAFTDRHGTRYFDGVCRGSILTDERGSGGFGYDAIFKPEGLDDSFAELSAPAKNRISHRGQAVRAFFEFVRDYRGDE